jgi:outer membrane protein OmpA-like peptidoglycan-associated protein
MHPPTLQCSVSPATVQAGEMATVTCTGSSEDSRSLTYQFDADRGQVHPQDNTALIDTRNLPPGPVNITAKVMDDRDLSANTSTVLNVTAPPPPPHVEPQNAGAIAFKPKSSYVDNRAKAVLDGIALRLQQDPAATLLIAGSTAANEDAKLAQLRADHAKTYLTKDKGIDPNRIDARAKAPAGAGAPTASTASAEIWFIPQGAQKPF